MFNRNPFPGELIRIGNLSNLERIILFKGNNGQLGPSSGEERNQSLSNGLPTLTNLDILCDIFQTIPSFNWNQYFPNLNGLMITHTKIVPNDLIVKLTELESLSFLSFVLPNLNDFAFTVECENRFEAFNNCLEFAPAIACLKSLERLKIICCPLLTNDCVINGISKCKTLKEIVGCIQMTNLVKQFLVHCNKIVYEEIELFL